MDGLQLTAGRPGAGVVAIASNPLSTHPSRLVNLRRGTSANAFGRGRAAPRVPCGGAVVGVVAIFSVLSLFSVTTVVSDDAVRVWFGIGLISRRIALNQITSARTVTTHWIYGWGIRWIPRGWLSNVSGLDGVELALVTGRRFRIGTDEPERLAAAIQGALRRR
jgi:hypothetical protein